MSFFKSLFTKEIVKEILTFTLIIAIMWCLRKIIDLILLTFLFTYLIYSVQQFIYSKLKKITVIKRSFITIVLYLLIFMFLFYFIYRYVPIVISQSIRIVNRLFHKGLNNNFILKYLTAIAGQIDIKSYIVQVYDYIFEFIGNLGKWSINVIVALILSMVFILETSRIKRFVYRFKASKISGIYKYIGIFSRDFLNSIGKVIQVQVVIALINTIISIIILSIMKFPGLIALTFMIFVFSLIPVAGTIMSLIPLSIIAFSIGGIIKVIDVTIMIILLYVVEAYILNPKLMSDKTRLPVFFVFIVLIISQHFMGISGILIGVPLFIFLIHLVGVDL